MKQVVERHEGAYTQLVDRYLDSLYAFIYRFCGNQLDAEDLAQDTFVRVWERASTWREGKVQFKTWLFQIARNLCIDVFRKRRRNEDGSVDPDTLRAREAQTLEHKEKVEALYAALAELPERQRTALVLCNVQGWSQAEVAVILECTVDAVDALLGRGRRTLRIKMAKFKD